MNIEHELDQLVAAHEAWKTIRETCTCPGGWKACAGRGELWKAWDQANRHLSLVWWERLDGFAEAVKESDARVLAVMWAKHDSQNALEMIHVVFGPWKGR